MWDLPGPGLEPVSPALAGRLSTTAPPGKPKTYSLEDKFRFPSYQRRNQLAQHRILELEKTLISSLISPFT
ncbi:hypothetical protein J1605_010206 [Eschrichtius robustus]|uniref:Uncharacterized protein n=1 Tax=Eschrichtius robustus TaxID=9764 RepID=A0AB34GTB6_ESCRO|nr:hypothetical protein J1605_010206 [Eschrichtius robustus]